MKAIARDLRKEVQYQKQRENKLMYFLFILQEKKYPVYDLFEEHIKDLETERFSKDCDDRFKELFKEQESRLKELGIVNDDSFVSNDPDQMRKLNSKSSCSFVSDASYAPIATGPAPQIEKPDIVPSLDFNLMKTNLAEVRKKEAEQRK